MTLNCIFVSHVKIYYSLTDVTALSLSFSGSPFTGAVMLSNDPPTHNYYLIKQYTVCPRSSDPFYVVIYNIKWVTTSWTNSTHKVC